MKNEQPIHLNISDPTGEFKELIFRVGEAIPAKTPRSIIIDGTLSAPFQFLEGKKGVFEDKDIHLQIFKDKGKLVLHLRDTDPYTEHVITGALRRDSVLEQFKINTDYRWRVSELVKFIKTMRYYFSSADEHKKLLDNLQKWSAKIETVIKEHNDQSGNSLLMLEKKVNDVDLNRTFNVELPIFQGYDKKKFKVEIGLDPKNTSVELYLISDELIELEIGFREKLIAEEISKFDSSTFSKVIIS